jgi:hypothetical protein
VPSLPEFLELEVLALGDDNADASMRSSPDAAGGLLAAGAEWLVRQAVTGRGRARTISISVRVLDAALTSPYHLAGRRSYVGTTSEEWTVDVAASGGHLVARVDVALSFV